MEPRILDQVELSSKGGCCPVAEGAASGRVATHQDVAGLGKSGYSPQVLPSLGSGDCKEEPAPHQLGWESHVPQVENWLRVAWRLLFIGYFFLSADGTKF